MLGHIGARHDGVVEVRLDAGDRDLRLQRRHVTSGDAGRAVFVFDTKQAHATLKFTVWLFEALPPLTQPNSSIKQQHE